MAEPRLLTAEDIEPERLNEFLRRSYPALKSEFLIRHGTWWHGSNANRLLLQVDGEIAGYCAVIPARVWVAGEVRSALWWVDLILDPAYRGRGLQSKFDRRVREMADILLGIPNELAARIHRKHGWGVRHDMMTLMLPLHPLEVKTVRQAVGNRRWLLRTGALGLSPVVAALRAWLSAQPTPRAWKVDKFDSRSLEAVFMRSQPPDVNTTWRDSAFFEWRYGLAPQPGEYEFFMSGPSGKPTHYLIARHMKTPDGLRYTRILDLFGDFSDTESIRQILILAVQNAMARGSSQVTLLSSQRIFHRLARQLGFLISTSSNFCWWSTSSDIMASLSGENYWTLSDSDNDAPD